MIRLSWKTARQRWEGKIEKKEENVIPDEMKWKKNSFLLLDEKQYIIN